MTFPSLNQKLEKALAEFRDVSSRYSSRSAGKIAKYYAGLCLIDLKNSNEAIKELEPLSKEKSDYGALALVALAGLYENSGNLAKAADVYQKLAANDSSVSPKDMSLMHLAQLYEQQNKAADAIKTYQQVVKEFPGSSSSTDAEQKLKQLSQ